MEVCAYVCVCVCVRVCVCELVCALCTGYIAHAYSIHCTNE